jgi:hypothetical protein
MRDRVADEAALGEGEQEKARAGGKQLESFFILEP